MPENTEDSSEFAVPIYRHQPQERPMELATGDMENIRALTDHIERYFGKVEGAFHEIISDLVHIDVHAIRPTPERNYHTLITTGMSDRPMKTPPGAEHLAFTELVIMLPPDWKLSEKDFQNERNYWPILWMKRLARLPHEFNTWLFHDHTVPNGDPAKPFSTDTAFCCWWLWDPYNVPPEAMTAKVSENKEVHFLQMIPLYPEEMMVKLRQRSEGLITALNKSGLTPAQMSVINKTRPNALGSPKRGLWPFSRL